MHISHIRRALKSLGLSTCIALAATLFVIPATPSTASAQVVLSVTIAPPILPVYTQPVCPGDGYIWTPGYWSYSDDGGYFWVPGTWVEPPTVGSALDAWILGLVQRRISMERGLLGPRSRLLRRYQLWFRLCRHRLLRRALGQRPLFYNSRVNNVNVHIVHNVYQRPSSCTIRTSV